LSIIDPTGRKFSNARQQEMVSEGWVWSEGVWTNRNATKPTIKPTGAPPVSDLGTLAIDLLKQAGTSYINRELGSQPVGYSPAFSASDLLQLAPDVLPGVDVVAQQPSDCGDYVYKKVCGQYKWVKKRRRRRRPIATNAEIGQVQAISSVLKGDNLKVWLAKRA
jgi:hypothetical protein